MVTVFFDADGVIQRASPGCFSMLADLVGAGVAAPDLVAVATEAEQAPLVGVGDFAQALGDVLAKWGLADRLDAVLAAWLRIDVDEEVLRLVRELRARGTRCFVASNQCRQRATYMSVSLRYAEMFDGEVYSCDLGVAKPCGRFFDAMLTKVGAQPAESIFIDDSLANVESASSRGIRTIYVGPEVSVANWVSQLREFVT